MGCAIGCGEGEEYKRPHAAVLPGVLATISACNTRIISIFLRESYPARFRRSANGHSPSNWNTPSAVSDVRFTPILLSNGSRAEALRVSTLSGTCVLCVLIRHLMG
jgi:hypothetical protein